VTTYGSCWAPARALALAIALSAGIAVSLSPRAGWPAPAPVRAPVVFFWSSPSPADAAARPLLLAAVQAAAAETGARVLDLSPPVAVLPDTASRVTRAVTAYDAMRFADAIAELDTAAASAAEHGAHGLSRDALVDLFLYRALAKTEAGDQAGAWNDFVRAATLDPARVVDTARFRPSAVKSFARAVQEVSARAPVTLTIQAPAGSRIHIDARATGRDRVAEPVRPGEHYVWVERPSAPPFARTITLSAAASLIVPEDGARPPDDVELRRRAVRLGAGVPLVVALSRQDGVAMAELRSLERSGGVLRGAVRLGPSPEADARDLRQAAARALRDLVAAGASNPDLVAVDQERAPAERRWYQNRWLWFAIGAAGALAVASPFLLDSSDEGRGTEAVLDLDELSR
jgi:hypothetical protein